MNIVGVDPGIQGALALFRDGRLADLEDMPVYDGRVDGSWVGHFLDEWGPEVVYLEWTQPMPKNGSIASYSLGLNSGIVIGVVQAMGFPLERVRPQAWKKAMGLLRRPKSASRGMAVELFPDFADQFRRVKDDGRAEAALIARYGAYQNIRAAYAGTYAPDYARDIRGEGDVPFKGLRELADTVTGLDDNEEMASVSDLSGARKRHPAGNGVNDGS